MVVLKKGNLLWVYLRPLIKKNIDRSLKILKYQKYN